MSILESIFKRRLSKEEELIDVWRRMNSPSLAGRELQQHRAYGEREQFKRKTDELRKLQGKPAWQWRD